MRESLPSGTKLELTSYDQKHERRFTVDSVLGSGASCIVYEAYFRDEFGLKHNVKLKECFPISAAEENRSDGTIIWKTEDDKHGAISSFEFTYKQHLKLQEHYDFVNSICKISDTLYWGNDTAYIVMEFDNGVSFGKAIPESLYRLLKELKALAGTIGKYHEIGFLHLDIKPENFMVIPDTDEMIKLFDFDSLVMTEDISEGLIRGIAYTNDWAAPEVKMNRLSQISEASDVYSIGALLFYAIYGRKYEASDIPFLGKYDLSGNPYFYRINPKAQNLINRFLAHTLCNSPKRRYQSMEEVCQALEEMIIIANSDRMYLIERIPRQSVAFVGREKELADIDSTICKEGTVVISGMGGIGKSELAKYYARSRKDRPGTICWIDCSEGLEKGVTTDNPLAGVKGECTGEQIVKSLLEVVTDEDLIVLDNVSDWNEALLQTMLKASCRFICTTRFIVDDFVSRTQVIQLNVLENERLVEIYKENDRRNLLDKEEKAVYELISEVEGYTLLVPLLAKQAVASGIMPSELLNKYRNEGLSGSFKEKVTHSKDTINIEETMLGHVKRVFQMADLSDGEKEILYVLAAIGKARVGKRTLAGWCTNHFPIGRENYWREPDSSWLVRGADLSKVNNLITKGWLFYDEDTDRVSLHDVITQLLSEEAKYTKNMPDFTRNMEELSNSVSAWKGEDLFFTENKISAFYYSELIFRYIEHLKKNDVDNCIFISDNINLLQTGNENRAIEIVEQIIHSEYIPELSLKEYENLYETYLNLLVQIVVEENIHPWTKYSKDKMDVLYVLDQFEFVEQRISSYDQEIQLEFWKAMMEIVLEDCEEEFHSLSAENGDICQLFAYWLRLINKYEIDADWKWNRKAVSVEELLYLHRHSDSPNEMEGQNADNNDEETFEDEIYYQNICDEIYESYCEQLHKAENVENEDLYWNIWFRVLTDDRLEMEDDSSSKVDVIEDNAVEGIFSLSNSRCRKNELDKRIEKDLYLKRSAFYIMLNNDGYIPSKYVDVDYKYLHMQKMYRNELASTEAYFECFVFEHIYTIYHYNPMWRQILFPHSLQYAEEMIASDEPLYALRYCMCIANNYINKNIDDNDVACNIGVAGLIDMILQLSVELNDKFCYEYAIDLKKRILKADFGFASEEIGYSERKGLNGDPVREYELIIRHICDPEWDLDIDQLAELIRNSGLSVKYKDDLLNMLKQDISVNDIYLTKYTSILFSLYHANIRNKRFADNKEYKDIPFDELEKKKEICFYEINKNPDDADNYIDEYIGLLDESKKELELPFWIMSYMILPKIIIEDPRCHADGYRILWHLFVKINRCYEGQSESYFDMIFPSLKYIIETLAEHDADYIDKEQLVECCDRINGIMDRR